MTAALLDLARAAHRRILGRRSVVAAVAAYLRGSDRILLRQLANQEGRNAKNLREAHN